MLCSMTRGWIVLHIQASLCSTSWCSHFRAGLEKYTIASLRGTYLLWGISSTAKIVCIALRTQPPTRVSHYFSLCWSKHGGIFMWHSDLRSLIPNCTWAIEDSQGKDEQMCCVARSALSLHCGGGVWLGHWQLIRAHKLQVVQGVGVQRSLFVWLCVSMHVCMDEK